VPLVANPHVPFSGIAIERLTAACTVLDCRTLVVDAADTSPAPPEGAALELAPCIERLSPHVCYLAARGLPLKHVNTRGSAARLLDEIALAAPEADVVLFHAGAADLARLFTHRGARPLLLAGDHPEAVKHAYAAWKLLAQRVRWLSADLLLVAPPASPRLPHIANSLAGCADMFLGGALVSWTAIDPASRAAEAPPEMLLRIVAGQLDVDEQAAHAVPWPRRAGDESDLSGDAPRA
jgi:flagellar biosynthesis protein FlhG